MKKIFIFIFLLSFIAQAQAYDCPFDKIKIGVDAGSLEQINIRALGKNDKGATERIIFIEEVCKDAEGLNGIVLHLFFLKDKLVKINFENRFGSKHQLFDIATNEYNIEFNRIAIDSQSKKNEIYSAIKDNNFYFYAIFKDSEQHQEFLEILSNKEREKIDEYYLKLEEEN